MPMTNADVEGAILSVRSDGLVHLVSKVIPPRRCPQCTDLFTPKDPDQVCCGSACSHARQKETQRGCRLTAAIAGKKRKRRARLQGQLRQQFGVLTERDVELYRVGYDEGYTRGYNAAYHKRRTAVA
jgi:hypothetical protein